MGLRPDYNEDTKILMKRARKVKKFTAITEYSVLDTQGSAALVECRTQTGKDLSMICRAIVLYRSFFVMNSDLSWYCLFWYSWISQYVNYCACFTGYSDDLDEWMLVLHLSNIIITKICCKFDSWDIISLRLNKREISLYPDFWHIHCRFNVFDNYFDLS